MKPVSQSSSPRIQMSSEGGKFIEFDFVRSGRYGSPDVHLKCRITATTRPSKQQLQVPRSKSHLERGGDRHQDDSSISALRPLTRLVRFVPELANRLRLLYQLVVCVPRRLAEIQQDAPKDEPLLADLPDQAPVEERVLEWAEGLLRNGIPKIEVSPVAAQDGFEADDENDGDDYDEDEDKSSGFFSDELSETDNESTWTSDKQVQCSLGRYTLTQVQERKPRLVSHRDLPAWLQNNEYLEGHHRPPLKSWRACIRSVFSLHTESGNIWTHLLGALGFLALGVHFFRSDALALDWSGSLAFGVYFAGAALCLTLSTMYHTFSCHSARVCQLFCKMDYCGITILILGSFYPWLHFQFLCEPLKRLVYGLLVTSSGLLTLRVSMSQKFGEARYRGLRAGIFFSFALVCGILPSTHYGLEHGWDDLMYKSSFVYMLLMVAIYVTGCCVYATRVPERFFPGRCDLAFQSHQIFHILVLLGALAHYYGLWRLASLRVSEGTCPVGQTNSLLFALGAA
ncbi:adiponectin receptor protein 2 [Ixodes scapularis]|uniref:adiponectin receptor protein 2 n=1 Tax=Ixodes scapularis TaxID=6945 RepID=UPI001C389A8E|nr:adiponectin receptor protein 2 [Ixodes scapularis]